MGWGDTLTDVWNSASEAAQAAAAKAANTAEDAYNYANEKKQAAQDAYDYVKDKKQAAQDSYDDIKRRAEAAQASYEDAKRRAHAAADAAQAAYDDAKARAHEMRSAFDSLKDQAQAAADKAERAYDDARARAKAAADTAEAAYNYAKQAAKAAAETAKSGYDSARKTAHSVIDQAIELAKKVYEAAEERFYGKKGGTPVEPCPGPTPGPPGKKKGGEGPLPKPPIDDINIVSVDWLNGDDVTIIGACDQYVNLPRDAKWLADSDIPNIDRLGIRPRFLIKFDQPKSASFQWRIVKIAGGTPDYTATEEARNPNFKAGPDTWSSGSVSAGQAVMADAAQLVGGGGYKFQIEARDDKGKVVKSGIITTKRLFWIVELPMAGLTTALASIAPAQAEFAKHHMTLKQLPDLSIPLQENISDDAADTNLLAANVNAAINGNALAKSKAPHLLRVTYTDHLAAKNPNQRLRRIGVRVGPGSPNIVMGVDVPGLVPPNTVERRALWHNIVTGEGWFVSAWYTPAGTTTPIRMSAGTVSSPSAGNMKRRVSVIVSGLPPGTATIDVYVNVVDMMAAGLAFGAAADICVCTRAWWTAQTQAEQVQVLVHEIGHKVQGVAAGRAKQPDRVATQYDDAGHTGSHCFNGCAAGQVTYDTPANETASTCVMFGATNGKIAFCGNCEPTVKKVDIGAGF